MKPNPGKIDAIIQYLIPKTQTQVKSFLRITNYYRKFIKDYAKIAKPLSNILRNGRIINCKDEKYEELFNELKELIVNPLY